MSREYPCVYYDNGKCQKFTDDKYHSWCVEGPCTDRVPSNADRIRAMSDEELAEFLMENCPPKKFDRELGCRISKPCVQCVFEWLKQPAEVIDNG